MSNLKPIAIIGQSCRFPGGVDSPESFWNLLISGVDAITSVPEDRFDQRRYLHPNPNAKGRTYTFAAGVIGDVSGFDADYFGISAREAQEMDPQQRLLLEMAVEALERAGQPPTKLAGTDCGVYVGVSGSDYSERRMGDLQTTDSYFMLGAALSIAANRISHALDLHGPSVAVDTACSSSLAALYQAVGALQNGQCDLAIVGAVNLLLSPAPFVGFAKARMLARDGRCRAFGKGGQGYVRAEGGGALVLKPLLDAERDNDPILAVIRDVSMSTNGRTQGIALPSKTAQERLLAGAYRRAHVSPRAVSYCEAHGTGTAVGDPAEAYAIGRALGLRRPKDRPLLIGSVKSNIGHLEPASGLAGIIKGLAILQHGIVPPSLHAEELNPDIDFEGLNVKLVRETTPLPQYEGRRIVGINSFGFGGTNAHAILENYLPTPHLAKPQGRVALPLVVSGRTHEALLAAVRDLEAWLADANPHDWYDIAYTSACRRSHHEHRLVLRAHDLDEARRQLAAFVSGDPQARPSSDGPVRQGKVGLVFVGNGSQWVGMGVRLLKEDPVFRVAMQHVDAVARWRLGWSVIEVLTAPHIAMDDTRIAQPLLFALQAALVESLKALGLQFDGVLGHSVGEVAAAYAAGALTLEQALLIIRERSAAQATTRGKGKMMVVALDEAAAAEAISSYGGAIEIAAVNSRRSITLSGAAEALLDLKSALSAQGVGSKVLDLDFAFHSATQDPTREQLAQALGELRPAPESRLFYSSVTGAKGSGLDLTGDYWWRNVRDPVRFADAIARMEEDGFRTFIEVGPNALLQGNLRSTLKQGGALRTLGPGHDGLEAVSAAVDGAFLLGAALAFDRVFPLGGATMNLPTYPWQRERHWYEPTPEQALSFTSRQDAPLLGARVDPHLTVWNNLFDVEVMPFAVDHGVDATPIVSATTFIEMAFEAAGQIFGEGGVEIEGFKIHRPLVLDTSRMVRFTWLRDGGYFRIESREHMRASSWLEHATGRLSPQASMPSAPAPPEVRAGPISKEAHYAFTRARRFAYGPAFQVVEEVAADENAAIARLRATDTSGVHRMSPALLDGVLQAIFPILQQRDGTEEAFLPSGVGRIWLRDAAPDQAWTAEVRLGGVRGRSIVVDGVLRDEQGEVVAALQDIRLVPAKFARGAGDGARAFVVSAEPLDPLTSAPAPQAPFAALSEAAAMAPEPGSEDLRLLDSVATAFATDALLTLNEASELTPAQEKLFGRLVTIVESQEETLTAPDEIWREALARSPHLVTELALLGHTGRDLVRRLACGAAPAPGEETQRRGLDGVFVTAAGRAALLQGVGAFIAAWPPDRRLRILDISESGDEVRRALTSMLPAGRCDLAVAEHAGAARWSGQEAPDGLKVESLDLLDPSSWPEERFDLIVGADVTGALDDLSGLARPGATLFMSRPRLTPWTQVVLDVESLPRLPSTWAGAEAIEIGACALVIARAPSTEATLPEPARHAWRIAAGPAEHALAEALAVALRTRGQTATLGASCEQAERLIHLEGLAAEGLEGQAARADAVTALLTDPRFEELAVVTSGGLPTGVGDAPKPEQALLPGLLRVCANERPGVRTRLIDLHGPELERVEALADELVGGHREETLLTPAGRFGLRLDQAPAPPRALAPDEAEILTSTGGSLDRLAWSRARRRAPGPDEIEVEVGAVGLNFRDVMFAMGVLPPEMLEDGFAGASLGMEAAGRVTRLGAGVTGLGVGDAVVCFATSALASHVVTRAHAVAKLPPAIGLEAGATIMTAFFTAVYSLATLARLRPGERVLIHGAAGGVGVAALQYARHVGAEVFATAGSDEKRDFVALCGVQEDHVLDSRSTEFAAAILNLTEGQGVDVVLNSLAGEAMYRGLSLLRPFGRFIELGKVDFLANSRVGLTSFRHNIAYHGVDADELLSIRPDVAADVLNEVMDLFARGVLAPLPYRTFPRGEVIEAFRHMQRARHIGKIVISMGRDTGIEAATTRMPVAIKPDATYLVTGGLRGLGLAAAEWLADHGAKRLALVSRSGDGEAERIEALRSRGVAVDIRACDVADPTAVRALIDEIGPDLRGVIHAATVYEDGRLEDLTPESLRRVLAPKAGGALALDAATQGLDLDLFLMFSSISSVIGNPGQAGYVAANLVLEALAARRRTEGLAAQVVALAPVADTGHLTTQAGMAENFERLGLRPLTATEIFAALDEIVLGGSAGFLIADVNWNRLARALPSLRQARFRAVLDPAGAAEIRETGEDFATLAASLGPDELLQLLVAHVTQEVGQILRVPSEKLDPESAIFELGMDSLMGVELSMSMEAKFGVSLPPMALSQDVSIRAIAQSIGDHLTGAPTPTEAESAADLATQEGAQILSRHGEHIDADIIAEAMVEIEDGAPARLIS